MQLKTLNRLRFTCCARSSGADEVPSVMYRSSEWDMCRAGVTLAGTFCHTSARRLKTNNHTRAELSDRRVTTRCIRCAVLWKGPGFVDAVFDARFVCVDTRRRPTVQPFVC